ADMVILDDFAARSEGMRLGLNVKGTLGIIKKLMEIKKIDVNIQQLHFNLKKIDFRVKDSIFLGIFREHT
ncbi:MAG: DUF3368 domain-containing protein, partial [Desulfobacterales bacterium]|nr:DUF3368 domain-containing protein [Desulfobacterales bacterium]